MKLFLLVDELLDVLALLDVGELSVENDVMVSVLGCVAEYLVIHGEYMCEEPVNCYWSGWSGNRAMVCC